MAGCWRVLTIVLWIQAVAAFGQTTTTEDVVRRLREGTVLGPDAERSAIEKVSSAEDARKVAQTFAIHEGWKQRTFAIWILRRLGPTAFIEDAIDKYGLDQDACWAVRVEAIRAAIGIDPARATKIFLRGMSDVVGAVRIEAVAASGHLPDVPPEIFKAAIARIDDPVPEVAAGVVRFLDDRGGNDEGALCALLGLADTEAPPPIAVCDRLFRSIFRRIDRRSTCAAVFADRTRTPEVSRLFTEYGRQGAADHARQLMVLRETIDRLPLHFRGARAIDAAIAAAPDARAATILGLPDDERREIVAKFLDAIGDHPGHEAVEKILRGPFPFDTLVGDIENVLGEKEVPKEALITLYADLRAEPCIRARTIERIDHLDHTEGIRIARREKRGVRDDVDAVIAEILLESEDRPRIVDQLTAGVQNGAVWTETFFDRRRYRARPDLLPAIRARIDSDSPRALPPDLVTAAISLGDVLTVRRCLERRKPTTDAFWTALTGLVASGDANAIARAERILESPDEASFVVRVLSVLAPTSSRVALESCRDAIECGIFDDDSIALIFQWSCRGADAAERSRKIGRVLRVLSVDASQRPRPKVTTTRFSSWPTTNGRIAGGTLAPIIADMDIDEPLLEALFRGLAEGTIWDAESLLVTLENRARATDRMRMFDDFVVGWAKKNGVSGFPPDEAKFMRVLFAQKGVTSIREATEASLMKMIARFSEIDKSTAPTDDDLARFQEDLDLALVYREPTEVFPDLLESLMRASSEAAYRTYFSTIDAEEISTRSSALGAAWEYFLAKASWSGNDDLDRLLVERAARVRRELEWPVAIDDLLDRIVGVRGDDNASKLPLAFLAHELLRIPPGLRRESTTTDRELVRRLRVRNGPGDRELIGLLEKTGAVVTVESANDADDARR